MGWRRTLGVLAPLLVLTVGCGLTLGTQGAADDARRNLIPVTEAPPLGPVERGKTPTPANRGTEDPDSELATGDETTTTEVDAFGNPVTTTTPGSSGASGDTTTPGTGGSGTGTNPGSGTGSPQGSSVWPGFNGGTGTNGQADPYVVPPTIAPDIPTEPSERERLCAAWNPVEAAYISITSSSTTAGNFLPRVTELQRTFAILQPLLPPSAQGAGAEVTQILSDVVQSATVAADKFSQTILGALGKAAPVVTNQIIPAVPLECVGPGH